MVPKNRHIINTSPSRKLIIIFETSFGEKSSYDPFREINPEFLVLMVCVSIPKNLGYLNIRYCECENVINLEIFELKPKRLFNQQSIRLQRIR